MRPSGNQRHNGPVNPEVAGSNPVPATTTKAPDSGAFVISPKIIVAALISPNVRQMSVTLAPISALLRPVSAAPRSVFGAVSRVIAHLKHPCEHGTETPPYPAERAEAGKLV